MKPPDGIARLTPAEAWFDGYRHGREELALSFEHDKTVREAKDGRTLDRLDAIERTMVALQNDAADRGRAVADILRRVHLLEGSE